MGIDAERANTWVLMSGELVHGYITERAIIVLVFSYP